MPPDCRERWPQNRVSRGSKCCNCASSTCNFPSRDLGALRENIKDQRRAVQHLAIEDFFQVAALRGGKLVVEHHRVNIIGRAEAGKFAALPVPMKVPATGVSSFWVPSPTTAPPAVAANSANSSRDSRVSQLEPDLSSKPMRKTRSVLLLSEMSAFNVSVFQRHPSITFSGPNASGNADRGGQIAKTRLRCFSPGV